MPKGTQQMTLNRVYKWSLQVASPCWLFDSLAGVNKTTDLCTHRKVNKTNSKTPHFPLALIPHCWSSAPQGHREGKQGSWQLQACDLQAHDQPAVLTKGKNKTSASAMKCSGSRRKSAPPEATEKVSRGKKHLR